jgi:hypothetical protein
MHAAGLLVGLSGRECRVVGIPGRVAAKESGPVGLVHLGAGRIALEEVRVGERELFDRNDICRA